jgi:multisubunit Na+/H+ antiporter MnhE subunit
MTKLLPLDAFLLLFAAVVVVWMAVTARETGTANALQGVAVGALTCGTIALAQMLVTMGA